MTKPWGNSEVTYELVRRPSGNPFSMKYPDGEDPLSTPSLGNPSVISSSQIDMAAGTASTGGKGALTYNLRRSTDNSNWTTIATGLTWAQVGSYSSTGLSASTLYYYAVQSVDEYGETSSWSTSVSDTTSAGAGTDDGTGAEFYENFEGLTAGDPYNLGFKVFIDDTDFNEGSQSARFDNVSGGSNTGMQYDLSSRIGKGDEIWVRLDAKWQNGWLFNAGAGWKFIRIHTETTGSSNQGYNDFYNTGGRQDQGMDTAAWYVRSEPIGSFNVKFGDPSTENIDPGTWHTYEFYVYLDDVSQDSGGGAVMRVWRDGSLLNETTSIATLAQATDLCDRFHICTFFNPDPSSPYESFDPVTETFASAPDAETGSPQAQSMWVDRILARTNANPPSNTDSNGNTFIGV